MTGIWKRPLSFTCACVRTWLKTIPWLSFHLLLRCPGGVTEQWEEEGSRAEEVYPCLGDEERTSKRLAPAPEPGQASGLLNTHPQHESSVGLKTSEMPVCCRNVHEASRVLCPVEVTMKVVWPYGLYSTVVSNFLHWFWVCCEIELCQTLQGLVWMGSASVEGCQTFVMRISLLVLWKC